MPRSTLSLECNVKHKSLSPPVPSLSLFAVTEGDVIAWHDEIVYVKVHFIHLNEDAKRNSCAWTQSNTHV